METMYMLYSADEKIKEIGIYFFDKKPKIYKSSDYTDEQMWNIFKKYRKKAKLITNEIECTSEADIEDIMNEAFENNLFMDEEQCESARKVSKYISENDLDYSKMYRKYSTVKVSTKEEKRIDKSTGLECAGTYNSILNTVNFYDNCDDESVLVHELIHASGSLSNEYLNEGMTELLSIEYNDVDDHYHAYNQNVYIARLLCELIGPDKMFEAYSNDDIEIIYDELSKLSGTKKEAKDLIGEIEKTHQNYYEMNEEQKNYVIKVMLDFEPYISAKKLDPNTTSEDAEILDTYRNEVINLMYFEGVFSSPIRHYYNVDSPKYYKHKSLEKKI